METKIYILFAFILLLHMIEYCRILCISDEGIMVHCSSNLQYLELLGHEQVAKRDPILDPFTDDEKPLVIAILDLLQKNGYIKNADVQSLSGKSAASAKRFLKKMTNAELLILDGAGRGQKYVKRIKQ